MKWWFKLDLLIISLGLIIFCLGELVLFSVGGHYFLDQLLFFLISLVLYFLVASFDYRVLKHFSAFAYAGSLIFLILTFVLGTITRGVVRWIRIGSFNLQPAELVKPALILAFSFFATHFDLKIIKNVMLFLIFLFPPVILIFKQPDLGSTIIIFCLWLGILFASTIDKKVLLISLVALLAILPLGFKVLKPYQKERLTAYLWPQTDPLGSGYNLAQARIAIGSGRLIGKGLGQGSQSQLRFIPEHHSDFIFASLSEELGFIGASLIILSFTALCLRILSIANSSSDFFGRLICIGAAAIIFTQAFINIGMNLGVLPITGLTLPLVSYGGSSLVSTMIILGLVQSVKRQASKEKTIEIR